MGTVPFFLPADLGKLLDDRVGGGFVADLAVSLHPAIKGIGELLHALSHADVPGAQFAQALVHQAPDREEATLLSALDGQSLATAAWPFQSPAIAACRLP